MNPAPIYTATATATAQRLRTVELLSRNAERDAHDQTIAAARAITQLPQLFDADIVVLLHALACAVQRHNMHLEHRTDLVDEIEGWQLHLDELMDHQRSVDANARRAA